MPRPLLAPLASAAVVLVLACSAGSAAAADPLKPSRKCRKTIAAETAKLVKSAQKLVDRCHAGRVKGKPVGDCNTLAGADPKGTLAALETKAAARIDKACAAADPVRQNFPGGAAGAAAGPAVRAAVAASAAALQGAADLAASKAARKCHGAIGKARSAIVDAIVKAAVKCQLALDKSAATFAAVDAACVGDGAAAAAKAAAKVEKACAPRGAPPLAGADVGSCDPLPACVVAQATATGRALAALAFAKPSACGDGFLDVAEACPLLEGPGDAPAVDATRDLERGAGVPAAEISLDAAGLAVARTRLEIAFAPTATVGAVNTVLAALGAELVSTLEGVLILTVRIPDPGTLAALDAIIVGLEASPIVRWVNRGTFLTTALLPANYPPGSVDLPKLDHHLAVRAHAAWNARAALAGATPPLVLVTDFYGGGLPNADVDRIDVVGTVGAGASNVHGYHVLGTIAATLEGDQSSRGLATGMFPATSRIGYVDIIIDATTTLSDPEVDNRMLTIIRSANGNVVLNTSLQSRCTTPAEVAARCNATFANLQAVTWIEKVRGTLLGPTSLEGKFLNLAAGGNVTVAGDVDASVASRYAAARLLSPLTAPGIFGGPVTNLTNALVVENVLNSAALPFRPTCLSQGSKRPGDLAGIGTDVWSVTNASSTAGDLSGTSMATPQVAGLAAYVWALEPALAPQDVSEILLATARLDSQLTGDPRCDATPPSPTIDAYAAVLATDDAAALAGSGQAALAPVRLALLDVADSGGAAGANGAFDEQDVSLFLAELDAAAGAIDHSRFDLNGDAATGGTGTDRFDLTIDPSPAYVTLNVPILGEQVPFDERAVTDFEVLCFYAFSPLYTGDADLRDDLLPDCAPEPCPKVRTGGRISVGELPECTINFAQTSEMPLPFDVDRTCMIGGLTFTHSAEVSSSISAGAVDLFARRETTGTATVFFQSIAAGDTDVEETITIDAPGMTGQQGTATPTMTVQGTMSATGANCGTGFSSAQWMLQGFANGKALFDPFTDRAEIGCPNGAFSGPSIRVGDAFTFTYGEPFTFRIRFDAQARAEGGTGSPHQATAVLNWSWDGLAGLAPGATVTSCSGVNWAVPAGP